jgi:hypothetical protein
LLSTKLDSGKFELYDLENDKAEQNDLSKTHVDVFNRMREQLLQWNESVEKSVAGKDYPEGQVDPNEPAPRFWTDVEEYKPYFEQWRKRWEYASRLTPKKKKRK